MKDAAVEPPLGLLYLASVLERAGHSVHVLDMAVDRGLKLRDVPDYVGVTATTPVYAEALKTLKLIKGVFPSVGTIIGGPHIAAMGSSYNRPVEVDWVVQGEGENAILDIVGGKVDRGFVNYPLIQRLDSLPFPDRSLLDPDKYRLSVPGGKPSRYTTIITSRGCPYRCIFCSSHLAFGRTVRFRSALDVLSEFQECAERFSIYHFGFLDDTATLNPSRWAEMSATLEEFDVSFHCTGRVDTITDSLLIDLKRAGCYRIHFGVESGVQSILDASRKGITLEQARSAFALCRKHGIETCAYFILNLPGETEATVEKTIDFAVELDPDHARFTVSTPFPGTELHYWATSHGFMPRDVDYESFRWYGSPIYEENIPRARLTELQKAAYDRFHKRVSYAVKRVRKLRSVSDIEATVVGAANLRGITE